MPKQASVQPARSRSCLTLTVISIILATVSCVVIAALLNRKPAEGKPTPATSSRREVTLLIAYSPEKQDIFEALVHDFDAGKPKLPNGKRVTIVASSVSPDQMAAAAATNRYQAVSPDSSLWLTEIDRYWAQRTTAESTLVGETTRYMVSPVVIAMWEDVATNLGYPAASLGWKDLLDAAANNPQFKWSHPSTNSASGLLSTLALFYAGAGVQRDLTEELATAQTTLDYVAALEQTVKYYGEGELAVMQQIEDKGRDMLDAFVVQEQLLVDYNVRHGRQLVAIYPLEGTLWEDHPLALLEHPDRTDDERLAFKLFRDYMVSAAAQQRILLAGYRPADLSISLEQAGSPINPANGADPTKPETTLQMPSAAVVDVVRNVWQFAKRRANIYLVVDVSGSMDGAKIDEERYALQAFLDQIQSDQERVGLITFSSRVFEMVPLSRVSDARADLSASFSQLTAAGNTALLDGVATALTKLVDLDDGERINAIVAMTDGKENSSAISLQQLTRRLEAQADTDLPVVVFCIAYGRDADMAMLQTIAEASGGLARAGDIETIQELYKTLSTYF